LKLITDNLLLLPCPRFIRRLPGTLTLPAPRSAPPFTVIASESAPPHPEGYTLTIDRRGVRIEFREDAGVKAAMATFRQLSRQYGRRLPCLQIRDWPDFRRRGVMLDISRGRVPRLETLLRLASRLADFKINELQLYTEHTFTYSQYPSVWESWGALTGEEIRRLDAHCQQLGIDLVPNQNSFGHLRYFLEHPRLKQLAEVPLPYIDPSGGYVRRPSTLAPNHPGTLPFLRGLYDELLPNFSSRFFNVGCDETWDLGRGQSKRLCAAKGQGRVYLDFLKQIHREVSARGKIMMFWGDIILKYPKLIPELAAFGAPNTGSARTKVNEPKNAETVLGAPGIIALNWGYEANHPFDREAALFAKAKIPFYVCPGTATWQTLIGRHDNAFANLRAAARAGRKHGALGYLITDWGDGGHPQPLAVSYLPYLAGAALSWCARTFEAKLVRSSVPPIAGRPGRKTPRRRLEAEPQTKTLLRILNRDVFNDLTDNAAQVAYALGLAHQKLGFTVPNETPIGTAIAAPPPEQRELFCRNGLKHYTRIPGQKIRAALKEIVKHHIRLKPAIAANKTGGLLLRELDLAARMAAASCRFMLWQQACAAGQTVEAKRLARAGIRELEKLDEDFRACWPERNKATPQHCSEFLKWRMQDYCRLLNSPRQESR
jgi:hexosaminidase